MYYYKIFICSYIKISNTIHHVTQPQNNVSQQVTFHSFYVQMYKIPCRNGILAQDKVYLHINPSTPRYSLTSQHWCTEYFIDVVI